MFLHISCSIINFILLSHQGLFHIPSCNEDIYDTGYHSSCPTHKVLKKYFFPFSVYFLSEPPSPQWPYRIDNRNSTLFISWEFLSPVHTQDQETYTEVKYDLYGVLFKKNIPSRVLQYFREHFYLFGKEIMPVRLCHLCYKVGRWDRPEVNPDEKKMQAEQNTWLLHEKGTTFPVLVQIMTIGICQSIHSYLKQVRFLRWSCKQKGKFSAHEGEVQVLWKGASAAVETGNSLFTQYCYSKGRKHEATNFTSSAAFLIQPAKSVFPGVRICG